MSHLGERSKAKVVVFWEERAPGSSRSKRRQVAIKQVGSCRRLVPRLGST